MKFTNASRVVASLTLLIASLAAADTVTVNGTTYECQTYCNVTTMPNGGTMVTDANGGWVRVVPKTPIIRPGA